MTPRREVVWKVLYLFAGTKRQADLGAALHAQVANWNQEATTVQVVLHLEEVDTLREGMSHNLLDEGLRKRYLSAIAAGA